MKKSYKWIPYTILTVVLVVGILCLALWNPAVGLAALLLVILTLCVSRVLRFYFNRKSSEDGKENLDIIPLPKDQADGSQKLLRYATAVLSFLSLMTTAAGMKGFVFSNDWQAYLASFGVQSILVVFSLLLCRFFVQVSVLGWPKYVKEMAKWGLVLFFCISLMVSSVFSFTYIADNAYAGSWASDSESILHEFLLVQTRSLQVENNLRGKELLDYIVATSKESLAEAMEQAQEVENQELKAELYNLIQGIYAESAEIDVSIDKEEWLDTFPRYADDIIFLYNQYDNYYKDDFDDQITVYNTAVDDVEKWKKQEKEELDVSTIKSEAEADRAKLEETISTLNELADAIDEWRTSGQNVDNSSYRGIYKSACKELSNKCSTLLSAISSVKEKAEEFENQADGGTGDELDSLLSDIYLLGIDENVTVEELMSQINTLALRTAESEDTDSNAVLGIISLRDALLLYGDYVELKDQLETYIEDRVKIIYQMEDGETEDWKNNRNQDLNNLYIYVNSLPDISVLSDDMGDEAEGTGESGEAYNQDSITEQISVLQRNLLGKLTTFEKAFLYFQYRYPVMAYFSAFIAVFFDLGAFFTGCFLYISEYFQVEEEKEDSQDGEGKDEENGKVEENGENGEKA